MKNKKLLTLFYVGALIILLFTTAVIPGLLSNNPYINVGSLTIGILSLVFGYYYVRLTMFKEDDFELFSFDDLKEPETELDYNPDFLRYMAKQKRTKRKLKPSNRKQKTPA